jgi:hypothetical protein
MAVDAVSFWLKPSGFFDQNPFSMQRPHRRATATPATPDRQESCTPAPSRVASSDVAAEGR